MRWKQCIRVEKVIDSSQIASKSNICLNTNCVMSHTSRKIEDKYLLRRTRITLNKFEMKKSCERKNITYFFNELYVAGRILISLTCPVNNSVSALEVKL